MRLCYSERGTNTPLFSREELICIKKLLDLIFKVTREDTLPVAVGCLDMSKYPEV